MKTQSTSTWIYGVDFDIGDKVYVSSGKNHVSPGILCGVLRDIAYVKFSEIPSPVEVPLSEISPYVTN